MKKANPKSKHNYDDNLKDIFANVFEYVASVFLGFEIAAKEPLPIELNKGAQRRPDFFHKVTDTEGKQHFVHIEFQTGNDADMLERMWQYYTFSLKVHKGKLIQIVLYFGNQRCNMEKSFEFSRKKITILYGYELFDFRSIDYQEFFKQNSPKAIVLSILGDYGQETAKAVLYKVYQKIKSLPIETTLKRNALVMLYQLSRLRRAEDGQSLDHQFTKLDRQMDNAGLEELIDIENDYLYNRGKDKGRADMKKEMEKLQLKLEKELQLKLEKELQRERAEKEKELQVKLEKELQRERAERENLILKLLKQFEPNKVAELLEEDLDHIQKIQAKYA